MENILSVQEYESNAKTYDPVSVHDKAGRLKNRANIEHYEQTLIEAAGTNTGDMDEINNDGLKEYLAGGAYVRELFIPKDCTIVSKIWNKERMWIIATGEVTFVTEMGRKRVKAPYTEIVPHGSKVALYTHEDTLWFAITGAKSESIEDIEDEVIAKKYEDCTYPWDSIVARRSLGETL